MNACPEHVYEAFHQPATGCLLNYDDTTAYDAIKLMQDRNNPYLGHSQVSLLPTQDDTASYGGSMFSPN